uniref:RDD domain-containing protein n=1 Tax=Apteryx owenii TaxID=8824 RepID=A0A8B9P4U9_APTOW
MRTRRRAKPKDVLLPEVLVCAPNAKAGFACSVSFSEGFMKLKLNVDFAVLSSLVCSGFPNEKIGCAFGSSLSAFFPNTSGAAEVTGSCFSSVLPKTNCEAGADSTLPKEKPAFVEGVSSFFSSDFLNAKEADATSFSATVPKPKPLTPVLLSVGAMEEVELVPKPKPPKTGSSFFSCCPSAIKSGIISISVAGREFIIPSLAHRFIAEMVDFFILFFIKATIVLSIMHLSGIKDISKFAMHYIIEEIDDDTSMEDLQKMMIVALIYRLLVCFYEIICIWGAGGATPGKFLLGLRVVTCDTSVLIAPSRVLVIPSSNVSMTTSTIRALIKNFSIASFFPAFITLLFFQHNRTAYDIVAGTIVVRRNGIR